MDDNSQKKLFFSVKLGKSYKNRGWALSRSSTIDLIPILPYEDECDIIVDGVPAKAHLNILPRIFYGKNENELIEHLYKLSEEGSKDRIELQLLLNKENNQLNSDINIINELKYKLDQAEISIKEFKSRNVELEDVVKYYKHNSVDPDIVKNLENKIIELESVNNKLLKELEGKSKNSSIQSISNLNDEIEILKNKNNELEVILAKLLKKRDQEKEIKKFLKDLALKIDELNID